jgi:hypothetical protein
MRDAYFCMKNYSNKKNPKTLPKWQQVSCLGQSAWGFVKSSQGNSSFNTPKISLRFLESWSRVVYTENDIQQSTNSTKIKFKFIWTVWITGNNLVPLDIACVFKAGSSFKTFWSLEYKEILQISVNILTQTEKQRKCWRSVRMVWRT